MAVQMAEPPEIGPSSHTRPPHSPLRCLMSQISWASRDRSSHTPHYPSRQIISGFESSAYRRPTILPSWPRPRCTGISTASKTLPPTWSSPITSWSCHIQVNECRRTPPASRRERSSRIAWTVFGTFGRSPSILGTTSLPSTYGAIAEPTARDTTTRS